MALNHAGNMPAPVKSIPVHVGGRIHFHTQSGRWKFSLAARDLPAFGWPRAAVCHTLLISALALFFAGCTVLKSGTTTKTTSVAAADIRPAHDPTPVASLPETSSKPAPQSIQPVSEAKPQPAAGGKGAERLVAPTAAGPEKRVERAASSAGRPATPPTTGAEKRVAVNQPAAAPPGERPPSLTRPPDSKPPAIQDVRPAVSAPVKELIVKGPPREAPQPRSVVKALRWLGLGLGLAALAFVARLYLIRHVEPLTASASTNDELRMPRELGFKESVIAPHEPLVTDNP